MRLTRLNDQDERDSDGVVHRYTVQSKWLRKFCSRWARDFSERDWPQHVYEGNNKTRFEYCVDAIKFIDVHPCKSRTHWRKHHCTGTDVSSCNISCNWKENVFHRSCSFNNQVQPCDRTHCRRKRKQGGKTKNLLHTSQPFSWKIRRRSTQWRSSSTKESALPQQLEALPRCYVLDKIIMQFWQTKVKGHTRTRSYARRLHPQGNFSERRSNVVRKTHNPSTCTKDDS